MISNQTSAATVGADSTLLPATSSQAVVEDQTSIRGMTDPALPPEDVLPVRDLADIPAVEVISRAAVLLMSSAAEKLGLAAADPDTAPRRDLDEARRVITALAGLVTASAEYLGPHAGPLRDGVRSLQHAFREASAYPDEPGKGPGEKFTGPVR